jgi:hypothetical protein
MASGDDSPTSPPPPRDAEDRADAQWEILARREARIAEHAAGAAPRIPRRIRWWIAAFFIIALVVVFRDRIAEWLPGF